MHKFSALILAFVLISASNALAKRGAPEKVEPIKSGDIEYRVDHSHMGCIEAWDIKHNKLIWRRQVYVIKYNSELERDVQDTFIKSITLKGNALIVTNEHNSEYQLDVVSLEVKVVSGALIESVK